MARTLPLTILVCLIAGGAPLVAAPSRDMAPVTSLAISRMKVFDGPLVAVGTPTHAETEGLAAAIEAFRKAGGGEAFEPFEAYLKAHPASPWRASLQVHLGDLFLHYGYFTRALAAWQEAWALSKELKSPEGRIVGDHSLSGLMDLSVRLGRVDLLREWEGVARVRKVGGTAGQRIDGALEGLWVMEHKADMAFRCGPAALAALRRAKGLDPEPETLLKAISTPQGTTLLQNLQWAEALKMSLQAAKRESGAPILVPSVIHWRAGHFSAILKEQGGRYLLQGASFGNEMWVSHKALNEEATGYALVPAGELPLGWLPIERIEASRIWGRGYATNTDDDGCNQGGSGGRCPSDSCDRSGSGPGPGSLGMAEYSGNMPSINLTVSDTPIRYTTPFGPNMAFSVRYSQRDPSQPLTFTYSNFGPKWRFSWQAYIKDDPTLAGQNVSLVWGLAAGFDYTGFNGSTQTFSPQFYRHDILVKTGPSSYELRGNDGTREIYAASDGAITNPRRIFLSQLIDPSGNTVTLSYDATMRLVSVKDPLNQVSILDYNLPSDPLKVTRITDPFGRHADFRYNGSGQLIEISDLIGIKSHFNYGPNAQSPTASVDFINALTTPYGTTSFLTGQGANYQRWLEAVDPLGGRERWEYRHDAPGIASYDLAPPTGVRNLLDVRNAFYWDQRAMALYPGDYTMAKITQFTHSLSSRVGITVQSTKNPLESRVWNFYPGQGSTDAQGTDSLASRTARIMEDGSEQNTYSQYNALGKVLASTDAQGRKTTYTYAPNDMDLLEVRNTTGGANELLAKYTYNTQHKPLTAEDSAGQTTTFTYNTRGQVASITNPKNETTTLVYDTQGYLTKVQGATPGATTTFTYDSLGRLASVAPADGAATTFEYDVMDRRTRVNYPDATYEETVYNLLDVAQVRDRAAKWTFMTHNALRQLEEVRDAEGRITRLGWCGCGTLESLTDPKGRITLWARDIQGRVISKIYDDLTKTSYAYDTASRLKQRIDAKSQTTNYTYFLDNNLKQVSYVNAQKPTPTVSYTYDTKYNRLASMTDGTGTTTFTYNPIAASPSLGAGRLASVTSPLANSTIIYGYDALGRVTTRGINGVPETRSFDNLGRLGSVSNLLGGFTYTYEGSTGRLSNLAYPNGQNTQFTYFDNLGQNRLKAIKNLKSGGSNISTFGYEYDSTGQIQTWSQQADAQTPKVYSFQYDAVGQVLNATLRDGTVTGQILKTFVYGYDLGGNRTSEQIDDQVTTASFNGLNQLVGQTSSAASAPIIAPKGKTPSAAVGVGSAKTGRKTPEGPKIVAPSARPPK